MSGKYRAKDGTEYDISQLGPEEQRLFNWLLGEYETANSWLGFQNRTAHPIIEAAKKTRGLEWQEHPLYRIQLDLLGNVGERSGESSRELSDMLK